MATDKSVIAVIRGARPSFKNNHDKVAFAVHASFLTAGYMLTATGPAAMPESALSSTSTDEVGIDGWNDLEGEYGFVYLNPEEGGKKVLVKCLAMNGKLMVSALPADKGSKSAAEPLHLEISVNDYAGEDGGSNYSQQFKNIDKLITSLNTEVLSKLGSSSLPGSSSGSTSQPSGTARHVQSEPRSGQPEQENHPQFHPSGVIVPPIPPFRFDDTLPGPGAGMYPASYFVFKPDISVCIMERGGFGGDGSMLVGPNDPRWFGGDNDPLRFPGAQPGVPPGARFDPYGPPGIPGFEPGRFTRWVGPGRGGRGRNTHPDLEQPGSGFDDYI
ncbi:Probable proteasome inhibitor [Linum grandiflorum]